MINPHLYIFATYKIVINPCLNKKQTLNNIIMRKRFYFFTLTFIIFLFNFQTFAQQAETNKEKSITKQTPSFQEYMMGWDFGIGSLNMASPFIYSSSAGLFGIKQALPVFAVGVRFLYNLNPYFGLELPKVNFVCPFRAKAEMDLMNLQFMAGVRGNTPKFFKNMSGYAAARFGYGLYFIEEIRHAMVCEVEVGLNLTSNFFIAFSYNLSRVFVENKMTLYDPPYGTAIYQQTYPAALNNHLYALRLGFNF